MFRLWVVIQVGKGGRVKWDFARDGVFCGSGSTGASRGFELGLMRLGLVYGFRIVGGLILFFLGFRILG